MLYCSVSICCLRFVHYLGRLCNPPGAFTHCLMSIRASVGVIIEDSAVYNTLRINEEFLCGLVVAAICRLLTRSRRYCRRHLYLRIDVRASLCRLKPDCYTKRSSLSMISFCAWSSTGEGAVQHTQRPATVKLFHLFGLSLGSILYALLSRFNTCDTSS